MYIDHENKDLASFTGHRGGVLVVLPERAVGGPAPEPEKFPLNRHGSFSTEVPQSYFLHHSRPVRGSRLTAAWTAEICKRRQNGRPHGSGDQTEMHPRGAHVEGHLDGDLEPL